MNKHFFFFTLHKIKKMSEFVKKNPMSIGGGVLMGAISIATLILVIFIHAKQSNKCTTHDKENLKAPDQVIHQIVELPIAIESPGEKSRYGDRQYVKIAPFRLRSGGTRPEPQIPKPYLDFFHKLDRRKYELVFHWEKFDKWVDGKQTMTKFSSPLQRAPYTGTSGAKVMLNLEGGAPVPHGYYEGTLSIRHKR